MVRLTNVAKVANALMVRRGDGAMYMNMPATKETYSMANSSPSHPVEISPVFAMEKLTCTVWEVPVRMMISAMWIKMPTVQILNNMEMEKLHQKMPVKVKKTY